LRWVSSALFHPQLHATVTVPGCSWLSPLPNTNVRARLVRRRTSVSAAPSPSHAPSPLHGTAEEEEAAPSSQRPEEEAAGGRAWGAGRDGAEYKQL
jgi:hypothetical protein